ncbi:hypothetical protein DICPUDRAFT_99319 [Dictyostelium purpureum]|uniref:Uncharacterized protein n=1 Tax=Dictyostelium purpureum TaxID=5786 RepID=F0ZY64_DICPU|nr:uncharacterized protein DICPUDRAFT_99319 [Dictyostelium purpureum]EGC31112.1 hypothetical protein DICPUDRAFT_99319 [Dictyostelium purpureum]|eukprot:XP_003292361.1 hypothetical protein DICPUDRAFT_99319 [Dictyostelium purpureum]
MYDPNGQSTAPPPYNYPVNPTPQGYAAQAPPPGYAVQAPPQGYAVQAPPQGYSQPPAPPTQPNQVNYAPQPNQANYPPVQQQPMYATQPVYAPVQPVVVTTTTTSAPVAVAKADDASVDQGAVNSALLIFVCGFFCTLLWLAGFAYVRHKNKTARVYGILSLFYYQFD